LLYLHRKKYKTIRSTATLNITTGAMYLWQKKKLCDYALRLAFLLAQQQGVLGISRKLCPTALPATGDSISRFRRFCS
jgi:hypothetical protein